MAEYLELEKVLDDKNIITVQTKEYGSIDVIPVDTITDIELSDVQPVKHGRWTDLNNDAIYHYECSCCKGYTDWHEKFCPNCGARMIKDGDAE